MRILPLVVRTFSGSSRVIHCLRALRFWLPTKCVVTTVDVLVTVVDAVLVGYAAFVGSVECSSQVSASGLAASGNAEKYTFLDETNSINMGRAHSKKGDNKKI